MKKSFYFALALTAGLFASCSSDEIAQAPQGGFGADDNTPVKIEIGMATAGYDVTRGTGVVGNVGGAADAQWVGQEFSVLMLKKGTMEGAFMDDADHSVNPILKGTKMTANGTTVVSLDNESVYYPTLFADGSAAVYDFWGYRLDNSETPTAGTPVFNGYDVAAAAGTPASYTWEAYTGANPATLSGADDPTNATVGVVGDIYENTTTHDLFECTAATPAVAAAGSQITVPFQINGTQDIMIATTEASDATYATNHPELIYSNKSARNGVKPNLAFKHLLTSLSFKVKPKTIDITESADNPTMDPNWKPGYEITNISLKSKATGELIVAYTPDNVVADADRIIWDVAQDWANVGTLSTFQLQCSKREVNDPAHIEMVQISKTATTDVNYTAGYVDMAGNHKFTYTTPGARDELEVYDSEAKDAITGLPTGTKKKLSEVTGSYGWILTYDETPRAPYEMTDKNYACDYKNAALDATNDLVPYYTNDVDHVKLQWSGETAATYKNTTEITAADYAALATSRKGGDVADAAALDAKKAKENVGKAYHQVDADKYYLIEIDTKAAGGTATTSAVVGAPMLVAPAPCTDDPTTGYYITVTYKYWKQNTKTEAVETELTTDPIYVRNYTMVGGGKEYAAFEAGKNYNITITLYSNGEVLSGDATSEPWENGGDLDANDED